MATRIAASASRARWPRLKPGRRRVHGTALGIGERSGNTPIDLLLVNLVMMGYLERDLLTLPAYCEAVARACDVPIPLNYPVIGADAFRTATGVHAAAVLKAMRKGDRSLVDAVYAAVPASLVGREQEIDIGPMSGRSNVIFWLERRGLATSDLVIDRVLDRRQGVEPDAHRTADPSDHVGRRGVRRLTAVAVGDRQRRRARPRTSAIWTSPVAPRFAAAPPAARRRRPACCRR